MRPPTPTIQWFGLLGRSLRVAVGGATLLISAAVAAQTPTATPTPGLPEACPGDCDGNERVSIDELVMLVNIALERLEATACAARRGDSAARITIDDLVAAVARSLQGCVLPTPTATLGPFAAGQCSETAACDPCDVYPCKPFGYSRESCCNLHRNGSARFSWCEVVDATGFCAKCGSACVGPRPTP